MQKHLHEGKGLKVPSNKGKNAKSTLQAKRIGKIQLPRERNAQGHA
ncbi:MAG: hypothetical protein JW744_01950 [Candidatus Diapherotrites archaeon]|uniref:Uncharacterized protein n=1 Tax=Candidatus Iainarchaeum sp. TaxID=3101447 RepID=A0A938YN30_9ARCH|nr:hypothetical protein [Candidatus Diapherotrites archaeon]